jgi:D-alanyl-D-alanine carboxypeptidase/D-alanyl-D-alanine-endopeptidase (penicillin-binding protein 4)
MLRVCSAFVAGLIVGLSPIAAATPFPPGPSGPSSPALPKLCPADFQERVNDYLQRPDLARGQWGIFIQPLGAKTPLFAYQAEKLFIPASTQKLLTTAIALDRLGPNFRFQTAVYADPSPRQPHQLNTLQVIASGDPTLQPQDLAVIATPLRQQGIKDIQQLQLVDQVPPEQYHRPSWEWDDLQYYYAPAVNQGILSDNQVTLILTPQAVGEPLNVDWSEAIAASQWRVINQTRTVINPQQPIQIQQNRWQRTLILQGELAPEAEADRTGLAIPDPAQYFLDRLKQTLNQQGIAVHGLQRQHHAQPVSTEPLLTLQSPPLSDIIITINQNSDNLYAEAVFNHLLQLETDSAPPTVWTKYLQALGIPNPPLRVKDGSGLSRQNLVSPHTLVQLLSALAESPDGPLYLASLPVAGESGTLKNRFQDSPLVGRVRAKTGTLTGVVTLAGFTSDTALGTLVFSIMVNNSDLAAPVLREAMDQMVLWSAQVEPCGEERR